MHYLFYVTKYIHVIHTLASHLRDKQGSWGQSGVDVSKPAGYAVCDGNMSSFILYFICIFCNLYFIYIFVDLFCLFICFYFSNIIICIFFIYILYVFFLFICFVCLFIFVVLFIRQI